MSIKKKLKIKQEILETDCLVDQLDRARSSKQAWINKSIIMINFPWIKVMIRFDIRHPCSLLRLDWLRGGKGREVKNGAII